MTAKTATEQLSDLKSGRTTSVELTTAAIERIEREDPALNAVVVRDFDRALEQARDADDARAKGGDGSLLGLPITVKEAFDVEGLPTTWGLPGKHPAAKADAVVVERLRAAGAVILGKTNVATMLGDWQTSNQVYGTTNNPWNVARTPGGSSGGSAVAVATGMSALEFGSDLAGSLRIPAAFCGVYAHRPSHGIVPMRGFAPPMAPRGAIAQPVDQSTVGPLARSATDLRLALDVVGGADIAEPAWRLELPEPRHRDIGDYRVLVLDEHPSVGTADEIRARLDEVRSGLAKAGCKVGRGDGHVPDLVALQKTFTALLMALMGVDMPKERYDAAHREGEKAGDAEQRSMTMSHRDWVNLDRQRLALAEQWMRTFAEWDVVICPAAPRVAFEHDARPHAERTLRVNRSNFSYDKAATWASVATPTGLPVTSFPAGLDPDGLPIGFQVIGPRLEDYTPIAFAGLMASELGLGFVSPVAPGRD